MFRLNITLPVGPLDVLCIGAHCDDIEIGCGGTLLALQSWFPGCRVHWLVLTSDDVRRQEALRAVSAFVSRKQRGKIWICNLPDGQLPACFGDVKAQFEIVKRTIAPDLIFTHHRGDRHQDHRLVGEVTWQTFRNHVIWEYEIPKYDGDLVTPNMYVPVTQRVAARKIHLITKHFASQETKSWFRSENLEAVMRVRGLECRSPTGFAEGFHCYKLVFDAGPAPTAAQSSRC